MTQKWWFWLAVGAVGARMWETHCAAARGCLGAHPYAEAFAVGNLTNSVFELSGAACAVGGARAKPAAVCGGSGGTGKTCCASCGDASGSGAGYKPSVRTSEAVMEVS